MATVLLAYPLSGLAQEPELQEYIDDMKSLLGDVEANGRTYRQTITSPSTGKVEITVNEINDKGGESETKYNLALTDINPRAVRSFTSRDIKLIEIVANGKQRLIKKTWEGGEKIAYISDFILYGLDDDNGMDLKQAFEESVPFALEVEKKGFSLETFEDHLTWLKEHIGPVQLSDEKVAQSLNKGSDGGDEVTFKQMRGERNTTSTFNLSQLNPNTMVFHVSGDEIFIEVRTKGNLKTIKHSVDGMLRDYRDILTIYANSPDTLKKIQSVLRDIIPLAERKSKSAKPDLNSDSDFLEYMNENIKLVNTVDGRINQHMTLDGDTAMLSIEEIGEKQHLENAYEFSLTDINANGIKNKAKTIKLTENGELQNYQYVVEIEATSISNAKEILKNFKKLSELYAARIGK